jgi:hypothetical protein
MQPRTFDGLLAAMPDQAQLRQHPQTSFCVATAVIAVDRLKHESSQPFKQAGLPDILYQRD